MAIHNVKEMGGSAMFCYVDSNFQMGVGMSENTNSYPYDSNILDQNDLINWSVEITNGIMKCTFTRPKQTNIQGVNYDLTNQYHIMLAKGLLQAGSLI